MSDLRITIPAGKSKKLMTEGKVCETNIIVTAGSNYQEGYDKGYAEGNAFGEMMGYEQGCADTYPSAFQAGVWDAYDSFWNAYQDNGNRTRYRRAFCGAGWGAPGLLNPKYPIVLDGTKSTTIHEGMFMDFNIYSNTQYDMTEICKMIDCSQVTHPAKMFLDAVAKNITVDFSSALDLNQTFATTNGGWLDNITLKVSEKAIYTLPFYWNVRLTTITFTDDSVIGNSITFAHSNLLTTASVDSIIHALKDLTGATAQTLTLHATVGGNLTDEQKAAITAKNWTLVY